jgi:tetratricopeptide (TPR) repeat protein
MSRPLLSLCMIVRDSAATLPACLESARPWVDELIVVDTGSVDNTRDIARKFGAQVFEFPWIDDFAAARNESLKHASGQWVFWMDSDDTIDAENGRKLRELTYGQHAANVLGYVVQVACPAPAREGGGDETTLVDHVKLLRNRPDIRFEGRIHEQVLPAIRRLGGEVGWTDLFVIHSGADHSSEAKQRKYERDLRILQKDLAERPDHPFVLFNLGMTYDDMGQHQEAECWLRRCVAVSDPRESHLRKAYALLASSLDRQGKSHEAHETCRRGLELYPGDDELLFRLGILEHRAGNQEAAIRAFRTILNQQSPRHFASVDRGITGYKARHNLALVYEGVGRLDLAEVQWRQILDLQADYGPARDSLLRLLDSQGRFKARSALLQSTRIHPGLRPPTPTANDAEHTQPPTTVLLERQRLTKTPVLALDDSQDWPFCHSRRVINTLEGEIRLCLHPRLAIQDDIVPFPGICITCRLRHLPAPDRLREFHAPRRRKQVGNCRYLGEQIGLRICDGCSGNVRVKEFMCHHSAHDVTTQSDCLSCVDYEPVDFVIMPARSAQAVSDTDLPYHD